MLRRYLRIRENLISASNDEDSSLSVNESYQFHSIMPKYQNMLSEIDVITKSLRTRERTLAQCRDDVDLLLESVEQDERKVGTDFYQCKLKFNYINSTLPFK